MTSKLRFMLDTNVIIDILNGRSDRAFFELTRHDREEICISVITYAELMFGVEGSGKKEETLKRLNRFLEGIEILDFDTEAAREYARVRQSLRQQGALISDRDMMIAAQANSLDLAVVTHNIREFMWVPGLEVVDWT